MVAITPRSFCNGPYFEPFRRYFLRQMRFRRIHVFDTRDSAFADDKVLQENVVFHAGKSQEVNPAVIVSASAGPGDAGLRMRTIKHDELVRPHDRYAFIHIVPEEDGEPTRQRIKSLGATLSDLGLTVSTGRVVDFRARALLRAQPGENTVPLIYSCHLEDGLSNGPTAEHENRMLSLLGRRLRTGGSRGLLRPDKAVFREGGETAYCCSRLRPNACDGHQVAFENHLNYFHAQGVGLLVTVAKGLARVLEFNGR